MSDSEDKPKDKEEKINEDDTILPQIGEDPGLPADAIEQDSKSTSPRQNEQAKGKDFTKTMKEQ
ncbi:MAG TPA: hypothetical protein VJ695_07565 [Nitrososphaera sp.]|nr:hypothetical protein [Nitrososphaera sp.]